MKKYILALFAILLMLSGCSKNDNARGPIRNEETFKCFYTDETFDKLFNDPRFSETLYVDDLDKTDPSNRVSLVSNEFTPLTKALSFYEGFDQVFGTVESVIDVRSTLLDSNDFLRITVAKFINRDKSLNYFLSVTYAYKAPGTTKNEFVLYTYSSVLNEEGREPRILEEFYAPIEKNKFIDMLSAVNDSLIQFDVTISDIIDVDFLLQHLLINDMLYEEDK